jgi:D-amino-acid dehydrogenase
VVGCATAFALARRGVPVAVFDVLPGPGQATSFANGAQLSYAFVEPLATPAALRKVPLWLIDPASPLRLRLRADPTQWRWLAAFTLACRQPQVEATTRQLLALSAASRATLAEWMAEDPTLAPAFAHRTNGKLVLHATAKGLAAAARQVAFQQGLGGEQAIWQPRQCVAHDAALAPLVQHMAGGVWTPGEAVGDAHAFCVALVARLRALGAALHFGTPVQQLRKHASGWRLHGQGGTKLGHFAQVVVCTANGTAALLRPLGVRVPMEPIKGYSITVPVVNPAAAPTVSVTDTRHKVVFAPLANAQGRPQLRVAGMAEIVGHNTRIDEGRIRQLLAATEAAFPGACNTCAVADSQPWAGLRPATPTGLPLIGPTAHPGLWLNTGHGSLGFTLACGSAQHLAQQLLAASGCARP